MAVWTDMKGSMLGPLTTAWSMPDSCTVHVVNCPTCTAGYRGQQCTPASGTETGAQDHTSCWPPVTALAGTPHHPFVGWGFYSPGLACPTGYTSACTARYGDRPEWEIQFTLVPGETAIGCCPEGFQCTNHFGNTCMAVASTNTQIVVATGVCSGSAITRIAQATFPDVVTATITDTSNTAGPLGAVQTMTREMLLLAPMFQLNFKSSDLVSEPTSSASSPTTTPATSLTPMPSTTGSAPNDNLNSTSDDSPSTPNTTGQGGLSTGAVAGIGVGAALGGMLLMAVVAWLWWRCVRKTRQQRHTGILAPAELGNGHNVEDRHGDGTGWMAAVHSDKQELPLYGSHQPPHSAGPGPYSGYGSNVRHELHGGTLTPVELSTESGRPGHAHYT